jgi:uncharacterized protein (UPF0264 family)
VKIGPNSGGMFGPPAKCNHIHGAALPSATSLADLEEDDYDLTAIVGGKMKYKPSTFSKAKITAAMGGC